MNNRINFGNYGYQDMNMINEMLMQNNLNNMENLQNNQNESNYNGNKRLAGTYEGYIKGNMFNDLYKQYENYKPSKLVPNNEQAELLLNVNQSTFAVHEIRLYLDLYPNDREMIRKFNEYQIQANNAIGEYERRYGPLLANAISQNNNFSWEAYSWPWEMEEM